MSDLIDLLSHLLFHGVELSIEGGKVRVRAPDGVLTKETLETLRSRKDELVRVLPEHHVESPLSVGQEGLWFIQKSAPESVAYNVAFALRIASESDPAPALRRALQKLVDRHAVLRTRFPAVNGTPRQRVRGHHTLDLHETDASGMDAETLSRATAAIHQRPFDLEREGAFRVSLLRCSAGEVLLLLCLHHIACDGWSFRMLVDELLRLYEADGKPNPLPPVRRTYQQFVAWQGERLASQGETLRRFWSNELHGAPLVLDLPTDRTRPPAQTFTGATHERVLDPALVEGLRAFSREQRTTLSTVLLSGFQLLLHRTSGQEDLCVGSIVAGREHEEFAGVFGYMVNQVAIRSCLDTAGAQGFASLVRQTRDRVLAAMERQDHPFPRLVQDLHVERDPSRPPVVQVSFVHQRVQSLGETATRLLAGAPVVVGATRFSLVPQQQRISELDLTLEVTERPESVTLGLRYNTDLFDASSIERMSSHLETLLAAGVAHPERPVSLLPLLGSEEREHVLVAWNRTALDHDRCATLHGLFEAQAQKTPDATAILCGDQSTTYAALNRRANQLAHHLRRQGALPESRIAVCVERSLDMIVSLFAVLKVGAAYVPVDPAYPQARQALMIEESQAALLITRGTLGASFANDRLRRVALDEAAAPIAAEPDGALGTQVLSDQLAYLLTTSGSTGRPKAVAIEHRNAVAMLQWSRAEFPVEVLRGTLASTSICFDLSVFEIFLPLSVGATIVLADNALALPHLAAREQVTLINTVPSAMAELLRQNAVPKSARVINLAGEKLSQELVQKLYGLPQVERVYNLYGPSEATTYSTSAPMVRGDQRDTSIGRPIANTVAYLLDRHFEPVPPGIPGELYLGGEGLARGYFERPALTAERFVPNPFGPGRLYRTGDLARHRPEGELEFLGRIDNQIKLRGFRIELGEIEAALGRIAGVDKAIVVAHGTAPRQHLVAYWTASGEGIVEDLQPQLATTLPVFMVPDVYVRLDAFPLTSTGKVDRRALPAPSLTDMKRSAHREPETPTEQTLASIWREVLGAVRIGLDDSFFHLGGHSLLSVQVLDRIRTTFGLELPLRAMFEMPTVHVLAKHIDATNALRRLAQSQPAPGSARRQSGRL
ncbi:non-ribosomal peptide synthetase [Chondromyces crocatus]|uniref:Non ribosomal peptide synthase n=1 Tax=Chondromyces crocatus TaxID=52 RepID=Q0VZ71_CHOCO|nr:non-ribosomal peptide synthetase [Chondromyces crocatus]AKT40596.1 uncharacterized protein CMC5_047520 [Chondromyces crocatus]CAJ46691.1 non ribosomal peptide synthase [Chondromyces crocatus]